MKHLASRDAVLRIELRRLLAENENWKDECAALSEDFVNRMLGIQQEGIGGVLRALASTLDKED